MGTVTILAHTTKQPITMIGEMAGVCWGADTSDQGKNYKRGLSCLKSEHGRTLEFPDVYGVMDGYSARTIREWYTHIGGAPTRLQASTRYIDYEHGFDYVVPPKIEKDENLKGLYTAALTQITNYTTKLAECGASREDIAMLLPLGMTTKIVDKRNLRNLIDMSHQRECNRAYHEYRPMFSDYKNALRDYSDEWAYLVDHYFQQKCKYMGFCKEAKSCGLMPKKEQK